MNAIIPDAAAAVATARKTWPDYRAVWRWHFYASLLCMPFVVILAISGGIYLFKPQIESWNDRPFDQLTISGPRATAEQQITAALAAVPGSIFSGYEVPASDTAAVRVIVQKEGEAIRAYVHPQTCEVLYTFPDNERFLRVVHRLHGELMMGDRGSMIVELAASWTIIMIVTGLYLWWPRQQKGWGGILYPRLTSGSRIFWRDLHSVPGFWISAGALFLLVSGLPWAKSWGNYLKTVRSYTGTAVAKQEWSNSSERKSKRTEGGHEGHELHNKGAGGSPWRGRGSGATSTPKDLAAVDRIAAVIPSLSLAHPVIIAPEGDGSQRWTVKSMTANRPYRENLVISSQTGAVISRDGFREKHWIDKAVSIGIAAHEGALFGWLNQLLGLLTALGLLLLCVSGVVMWWKRRDPGTLGAPRPLASPRLSIGLVLLVIALGIYMPLFGITVAGVLALEWLLLRRIGAVRDWLGLQPPAVRIAAVAFVALLLSGCAPLHLLA
jgi:uncharacterized iron-regulated membrane protein